MEDFRPEFADRLRALERRTTRLLALVTMFAVAFVLLVAWTLAPRPRVDARAFMLKDAKDHWRGALMTREEDGAPMVRLNAPDGRPRLLGLLTPDGSVKFRLSDSSGVARINLELARDGAPHVMVFAPDGHVRIQLRLTPENAPLVEVRDGERARFFTLEPERRP